MSSRGVSRVLDKLENAISKGNYYEAHQMYRTLYFRYIGQGKYDQCLELLNGGALTFFQKEQYSSGADLTLLIIDTLEKSKSNFDNNAWMTKLGLLLSKMGPSVVERETIISRAIKWSADFSKIKYGHPTLHKLIAKLMWSEGNIEQARDHYLLSRDGISCGEMLIQLSQTKGYKSEVDLFVAQVVLQLLCLRETKTAIQTFETYVKNHPQIGCNEPPFNMPLLNFIYFLLKTVENGVLSRFKTLCELYKVSLNRDPSYEKYLQKIGVLFFGLIPARQQPMGGLFGSLFNQLLQELDDDDDGGNENRRPGQQLNNSNRNAASTELD